MQKLTKETATMPRGSVETASLTYKSYKTMSRRSQLEPLTTRIIKEATEEEISTLRSYLEWLTRQIEDRQKVRAA